MDNASFIELDQKLFTRLHWGEMSAVTLHLTGGQKVVGDVVGVYRRGATGEARGPLSGEIRIQTAQGERVIAYDQINDIS